MLPLDGEIELISHRGECKQAVIWTGRLATARRRATALPSGETIASDTDTPPPWPAPAALQPGRFIFEPDAAVIRANLVGLLAARHKLRPVDRRIA
jgi:hypothetical protein